MKYVKLSAAFPFRLLELGSERSHDLANMDCLADKIEMLLGTEIFEYK